MEKNDENLKEVTTKLTKLILKENIIVTVLDLSHNKLNNLENIDFTPNLIELNLSNNNLECVPASVINLKNIRTLNLSFNEIKFFDETPGFCHTIEMLNISYNNLYGPPYWVWCEYPHNLKELDISGNSNIRNSLTEDYFREILQYKTLLSVIKMKSCQLNSHYQLLGTLPNAKILDLSSKSVMNSNCFSSIPCMGLEECCDIERLNLTYTYLSCINSNIDIYKNLIEINLSENRVSSLPNEFCNLVNLEICILSFNTLMYLPEDIVKLKKLTVLCLDSNKLCLLPKDLNKLQYLNKLDLYDNYIYEVPDFPESLQELDLAQNYFDEPDDEVYGIKRNLLRTALEGRSSGRKFEIIRPDSSHSVNSIDEELADIDNSESIEDNNDAYNPPSSPEDWDSDEYWVPHPSRPTTTMQSPWLLFVKKKMAEGNFCPMDAHTVSVTELIKYEKLCNPQTIYESDGQFDDYSSDNT